MFDLPVPGERFELPTNGLQNRCSTTELTRHYGTSKHIWPKLPPGEFIYTAAESLEHRPSPRSASNKAYSGECRPDRRDIGVREHDIGTEFGHCERSLHLPDDHKESRAIVRFELVTLEGL